MDTISIHTKAKILLIENMEEKVVVAGGCPFSENGSLLNVIGA